MIIEVDRKAIKEGKKDSRDSCPIAVSLKRLGFKGLNVQYSSLCYDKKPANVKLNQSQEICFDLPIIDWIRNFDIGKRVKPITINVDSEINKAFLVQ